MNNSNTPADGAEQPNIESEARHSPAAGAGSSSSDPSAPRSSGTFLRGNQLAELAE
jgi:hypothetical protein